MNTYLGYQGWKGWSSDSFGVCPPAAAAYYSNELKRSGVKNVAGLKVLEIGFGNGEFARWARDNGAKYSGTELIGDLVQQGVQAGFDVRDASVPLGATVVARSIDLIVAFDVFEHFDVNDLLGCLHSTHGVLRPSGRVIARVPSGDSPFSRAIQNGDVTHRLTIGSSMVRQLAVETGFDVFCIREPVFPLRGAGARTFMRRAVVRCVQKATFPILVRAFMGGGQPVLTPNMVFVLVKL